MISKRVTSPCAACILVAILAALLFSSSALSVSTPMWLQTVAQEIQAACRDAGTQWMVAVCLVSYLGVFFFLEKRAARSWKLGDGNKSKGDTQLPDSSYKLLNPICSPNFWLIAFIALVLFGYAFDYPNAARSLQVVVLLTGIVIGKGIALWVSAVRGFKFQVSSIKAGMEADEECGVRSAESPVINHQPSTIHKTQTILGIVVLLLAVASLWHPERGMEFFYRGQQRWTGPWDNPNLFGVLMGVGLVLAVGQLVSSFKFQVSSRESKAGSQEPGKWPTINSQPSTLNLVHRLTSLVVRHASLPLWLGAAGLCGYGLLKSYSRGAWLGTAIALALLMFQVVKFQVSSGATPRAVASWRRNWFPSSILLFSILVICFWQFRHTEAPLVRRVFSVGNPNDFSWRNRVAAWQGAGQMMWDKPLAGFGWGKAEEIYSKEYRVARLEESAAIQMNDYLMLGISAGIPALGCLLVYLSLVLLRNVSATPHPGPLPERGGAGGEAFSFQLSTVAASGAIVLLIGFWFDGGLFKLPTGVVFWVLVELCRRQGNESACLTTTDAAPLPSLSPSDGVRVAVKPGERLDSSRRRLQVGLLWLAGIAALAALGFTALHLGTLQLAVSERTLSIARKFLVPPKEKADFEFIAAKPIWSNQPLKVLLQHAHLANYNRSLVNWKLDDELYREFVLSPELNLQPSTFNLEPSDKFGWRRLLWEYFYPRIRKESSLEVAAEIVQRHLNETCRRRVEEDSKLEIQNSKWGWNLSITEIWQRGNANEREFQIISVAALRSAGIPARLTVSGAAEFWNGAEWKVTPRPVVESEAGK